MLRTLMMTASATAMLAMSACTANSEEKNYKLLEEDRPMFESEHRPMSRANAPRDVHFAAMNDDVTIEVDTAPQPTGGGHNAVIPTVFEDRSAWDVVTVGPVDGRTYHWPAYFRDCAINDKHINPVTPEAAFEQYVQDDTAFVWNNLAANAVQPAKYFFDLVVLPVRLIITPPLVTYTTP